MQKSARFCLLFLVLLVSDAVAQNDDPAEMSERLRLKALTIDPKVIGLSRENFRYPVFGIVTDMGYANAVATLVTIAEGTTSLYISSGGGIIGAGEHDPVRKASADYLAKAQPLLGRARPTTSYPYPPPGRVNFYFLTFDGVRLYSETEDSLAGGGSDMSELFRAAHEVIAEIRKASPQFAEAIPSTRSPLFPVRR